MLVCLLICFSVWQAPARLVEILLPERLVLTAVSGSFWSGEAGRSALQLDDGALASRQGKLAFFAAVSLAFTTHGHLKR
jgi:hypothetical protein